MLDDLIKKFLLWISSFYSFIDFLLFSWTLLFLCFLNFWFFLDFDVRIISCFSPFPGFWSLYHSKFPFLGLWRSYVFKLLFFSWTLKLVTFWVPVSLKIQFFASGKILGFSGENFCSPIFHLSYILPRPWNRFIF